MAKVNLTFLNDLVQAITRAERRGRGKSPLTAQNLLARRRRNGWRRPAMC